MVEQRPTDRRLGIVQAKHGEPAGRTELEAAQCLDLLLDEARLIVLGGVTPRFERLVVRRRDQVVENALLQAVVPFQVTPSRGRANALRP